MAKGVEKTNAMRILEQKKIPHRFHNYVETGAVSGMDTAAVLGENPNAVFKTLVTVGASGTPYVFMVPVNRDLDLKKAARCVGEKWVEMIKSKDLLGLTGYIHGGCSPVGMKKQFKTVIHQTAKDFDTIYFSGGRIGYQVEMPLAALNQVIPVETADIVQA